MREKPSRLAPPPLLAASALLFVAAFFAARFGDLPGAQLGSYLSTLAILAPPALALFRYLGALRAVLSLFALSLFAFAIETVGVATGYPYGSFSYGGALGPKLLGLVPYLLPVSYAPLALGAVAAAWESSRTRTVLRAALLLVLMDAVLDPGAAALGFWSWPEGGAYYGVPLSNYLGWLLSGSLAAALLLATGGWRTRPPPALLDGALLSMAFWTGAAVYAGLAFPALLGAALFTSLLARRRRLAAGAKGVT